MNALHQHLLDSYRAAQHAEPAPPLPGAHDVAVLREVRDRRRFDAVLAGRPATGWVRLALRRWLRGRAIAGTPVTGTAVTGAAVRGAAVTGTAGERA